MLLVTALAGRHFRNAMKARIKWKEGVSFVAESGSGHAIVIDGAPDAGGRNLGPRPMELVLMGTAACSAFDVVLILRKGRQDVVDCIAEAEAQRAESDPKVFTRIHIHFVLTGRNLDQEKVARAIKLSAEKYCSASAMLAKTAEITHDFEVVPA
jgi:putative redox protein